MLLSDALVKISYALRGLDDEAPAINTDEGDYWVSVLNTKKDELYKDTKQNWSSAYTVINLGTISASTALSFDLPDKFLGVAGDNFDDLHGSDGYIIKTNGERTNIKVIKPSERTSAQQLYISGLNPQTITFTQEITADDEIVGGTLFLPAYVIPDDVSLETDALPVPDADWLVFATAAELAFSDIIYEDKAEGLNTKANNLYRLMMANNRRLSNGSVKQMTYAVPKIGMR
jgi:hypothetical protein